MLWCMKTLSFKVPLYVGSISWRVRTLSLQSSFVCGTCGVVCGNIEILHKVTLCVGPVVGCVRPWNFQSYPVCMPCAVAREDFKFP